MDPPRFSGNEVDYPEFHRKWLAVVVPARLPEEAEIDRFRDALPRDAKEMLTGVVKLSKAWDILKKRYGDEDLIAIKLKNELKGLVITEKADHEKIITLAIKIRSLVSRLESIKASEALKYDGEFISAIYFQLPERHKTKWLEFDASTFPNKWAALLAFLDVAYERAVKEKLLLASYTPAKEVFVKKANAGLLATKVVEGGDEASTGAGEAQQLANQKKKLEEVRERVGKCPACFKEHTYHSRFSTEPWPSDRLMICQKFGDMTFKQRAETIQKAGGCSRCTSWKHKRSDCRLAVVDCYETISESRCHRDHSKMVCNSGVAYCLASKSLSENQFSDIDVFPVTLHYVQDIIVNRGEKGRTVWDDGSNRVLINNAFARENNLKSRDASVTMNVVGDKKKSKTKIYELDLQDMYGKQHSVWGYGIDDIIDPDEPVVLSAVRHLFPHVPSDAFIPLPKKRIDILMGINFNGLHPSGGLGVDAVGNLKALRSRFGCGWVIGGCHKDLKTSALKFSTQAAAARIARVTVVPEFEVVELETVLPSAVQHLSAVKDISSEYVNQAAASEPVHQLLHPLPGSSLIQF